MRRGLVRLWALVALAIGLGLFFGPGLDQGTTRSASAASHVPPRGVHLSFTGNAGRLATATWFTQGRFDPGTVVQFGPVRERMSAERIGRAPFPRQARGSASRVPGAHTLAHVARMKDLASGRVRYRVGSPGSWSRVWTFRPSPRGNGFTIAQIGDVGGSVDARRTLRLLRRQSPDLVLIAGDLSYAGGNQGIWDDWFDLLQPLAARRPVMAALGNHDTEDLDGLGGRSFKARLAQPGAEHRYTFEYGNVAFVVSTAGVAVGERTIDAELGWLRRRLAEAAARRALGKVDYVAVVQHVPPWTNQETRYPYHSTLVPAEERILQRYQVDLVLTGHDHDYERSLPMANGRPVSRGPLTRTGYIQVISGGGGAQLYDFVPPSQIQPWSAVRASRHHAVLYEVNGRTTRVRALASDRRGGLIDRFTVRARARHLLERPRAAAPDRRTRTRGA